MQTVEKNGTGVTAAKRKHSDQLNGIEDARGHLDPKEKKKLQNRIAQRTYRRNQKLRLRALEQAVSKSPEHIGCSMVPTESQSATQTADGFSDGVLPGLDDQIHTTPSDAILNDISLIQPRRPALHLAACNGNESLVRLLLEQGADATRQDDLGLTPLHIAAERGFEAVARVLLGRLVDPNIVDVFGRTALFPAIKNDHHGLVKLLLEAAVDVNRQDTTGSVALHIAVEIGSEVFTLLLLEYGADVNV